MPVVFAHSVSGNGGPAAGTPTSSNLSDVVDLKSYASRSAGFSGAEIASICREAALAAMEEDPEGAQVVARRHFETAMDRVTPQITDEMLNFYRSFGRKRGQPADE